MTATWRFQRTRPCRSAGATTAPDDSDRQASRGPGVDHVGQPLDQPPLGSRELGHALIDNGADVILGHHQHILKGVEIYRGKPIFYGLGHFLMGDGFKDRVEGSPYAAEAMAPYLPFYGDYLGEEWHPEARRTAIAHCRFDADGQRNELRERPGGELERLAAPDHLRERHPTHCGDHRGGHGVPRHRGNHRLERNDDFEFGDVLVLASGREPWGLVVNEGMACGLIPVVSDAVGCAVDLVAGVGEVFPVGDVEALAAALLRAAADAAQRQEIIRARLSRFTLAATASGYERAAVTLARRSGSGRLA